MTLYRLAHVVAASGLVASMFVVAQADSQTPVPPPAQPPAQPPAGAPQQPPGGRGQGRGAGAPQGFPAQQRPPGDPAVIAKGKTQYELVCAACHGRDLRGGDLGGPNLLRSLLVLGEVTPGEAIMPVVKNGRPDKTPPMPPLPLADDDIKAIAEYIHSVVGKSPRQGMPPPTEAAIELNVLVGDAAAGEQYFAAKCASCHSVTGDLQGIATRIPDPKSLQNFWVSGGTVAGRGGGRGGRGPSTGSGQAADGRGARTPRAITATVTTPAGEKVEGVVARIDDFHVALLMEDGTIRSFTRRGAVPKVEMRDPLEPHKTLLAVYTNKDMHNVTAYLATLK
ncbi:MAG TPA: c-type cytochrome [Vicinamibacterales bacterium]|nr:c-type cytochrome [Vicinamibacterales bacterium]